MGGFISDKKIEIVEVGEKKTQNGGDAFQQTIMICEVPNQIAFLCDFREMNCYWVWNDPMGVQLGEKVIKILYADGDYELIGVNGQAKCKNGRYLWDEGLSCFDENQFNALIAKYS